MPFYHHIDPAIFSVGPLQVRWYGLMYAIGFICSYWLVYRQLKRKDLTEYLPLVADLYFYLIIGLIVGARLAYVFIYNWDSYAGHPLDIIRIDKGGLSFHGGLIGTVLAAYLVIKKHKGDFWLITDLIIPTAPIGIGLVRIGNFINGELYGRKTNVAWAVVFPEGGPDPRHPSQLYEACFEGLFLFLILWFLKDRIKMKGGMLVLFLIAYGFIRFFLEFLREPDFQLGYILAGLTMGQILCALMVLAGSLLLLYLRHRKGPCPVA